MAKEDDGKEKILAAIRRAAEELGRAPSRGELRRITGVSHYRVLAEFSPLREAVRAAGLVPNPKGEKISTGDLLKRKGGDRWGTPDRRRQNGSRLCAGGITGRSVRRR
jgi:hypothetical protein